jgi:hypothetical protein
MVDSMDASIKGDYEAISTGYEQYVAKEVHNTQLINFLQVIGQFPEIKSYLKNEAFTRPLLRAFNMEPDKVVKTEEEVTQEMQSQTQAQQQQMEQQAQAAQQAAQQQAQMQMQMQAQQIQQQAQAEIQKTEQKALIEEKINVSEDQRKLEMQERLELIKQGNILNPTNLENNSVLLREQMDNERDQMLQEQENMLEQEEAVARQAIEQKRAQEAQMDYQAAEGGMPPPPQEGPAPGGMPEDPLQAEQAAQRLQGGPDAEQMRKEEFAQNAPQ